MAKKHDAVTKISKKLLGQLNDAIAREIQVAIQYMWQHVQWGGVKGFAVKSELQSIAVAEMKHAEAIAERLYYAIANRCAHMGGDLSAGKLEGAIITCPRHGSQFDVRDGTNIRWMKGAGVLAAAGKVLKSPRPVPKYNVKVEGNTIWIEV
jgi:nitrite reductase/ring-hydroxylating ferredoxin subunit